MLFPATQDDEVIGFLAVDGCPGVTETHGAVIDATVELLRQLRVRTLAEWYLHRQRELEDLRSTIATDYVEADHWEVVATTRRSLAAIGEVLGADRVVWLGCADGGVATERVWSRDDDPPAPVYDQSAVMRLMDADSPYMVEWDDCGGDGSDPIPDDPQVMVVPAVDRGEVKGAIVVTVPSHARISSIDKSVMTEIARLVQQMEEWGGRGGPERRTTSAAPLPGDPRRPHRAGESPVAARVTRGRHRRGSGRTAHDRHGPVQGRQRLARPHRR